MTPDSPDHHTIPVHIDGMHCASCELLLERALKDVPGITHARINHRKGRGTVSTIQAPEKLRKDVERIVREAGYSLRSFGSEAISPENMHAIPQEPSGRKWLEIGGAFIIIFALWKLLVAFDLVSLAPKTTGILSFGGVILIGVIAGFSSCLAVSGGLLLAVATKYNETHQSETAWQRFQPLLQFNIARLFSYFILGGLIGFLGKAIALTPIMTSILTIIVALIMLSLALSILKIIPSGSFQIRPPKALSHWIANLSEKNHPLAPVVLGAMTFFLPCGFTQSLQVAALASGSFQNGALTMFAFALGTLPALLGISLLSSSAHGHFSRIFLRFSGTLVLLLAILNLRSGLALTGFSVPSFASSPPLGIPSAAAQDVYMTVNGYGYEPDQLTIRADAPVRWHVDGTKAGGCTRGIVIPSLGIQKILQAGDNVIEFTAPSRGTLAFSCSMGMVRGAFTVL
ncbi:MAG: sulfite exporter TauE/SafE family protein [Candidatus Peregrinibacteria bacterium]